MGVIVKRTKKRGVPKSGSLGLRTQTQNLKRHLELILGVALNKPQNVAVNHPKGYSSTPKFELSHKVGVLTKFMSNAYAPNAQKRLTDDDRKIIEDFKNQFPEDQRELELNKMLKAYYTM